MSLSVLIRGFIFVFWEKGPREYFGIFSSLEGNCTDVEQLNQLSLKNDLRVQ
jgi:hypothetical protein